MKIHRSGFSLIELLIVIAIIGVMASMVVAAFTNASQDARGVVALQQTAVLQEALNTWITRVSSGGGSLAGAQTTYNGKATSADKLTLFQSYLNDPTVDHLKQHASIANALQTDEMKKTGKYVVFSSWAAGSYPKVQLLP